MLFRFRHFATTAVIALLAGEAAAAAPRGLLDHSLCCGIVPPTLHDDGTFDPAPDPVLRRHRMLPPPRAAGSTPAAPESAVPGIPAVSFVVPGADGFVTETPGPSASSDPEPSVPAPPSAESAAAPLDSEAEPMPPLQLPTARVEGHLDVGFETLGGFSFTMTKAQATAIGANDRAATDAMLAQIPDVIFQLDGRKVLLTGFMLPVKLEGALATEFLLVANSMLCCYGVVPPMNQWVVVKMKKRGLKPLQDVPVQIFGTLRVQPKIENGMLSTLYSLEGERMRMPRK